MDKIIVGLIVLLAVGYLYWRFRGAVKGQDASCGCGSCGVGCGSHATDCKTDAPKLAEPKDGREVGTGNP